MTKKSNANLIKLVNILSDGLYHDGSSIGDTLQITRSAVWKAIKKLVQYGVRIDSVKGKGYALLEPLQLLETNKIKTHLENSKIDFEIFESIESTNAYLKTFKNSKSKKICLAEIQANGKGRLNRDWYSPFGKNIYMSCLYPFQKDISELAGLSLVVGLAIFTTLKSYGMDDGLAVKWPNDILYENKKISGALIEIQAESHGASQVIIGIGINVNMLADDKQITQPWISMQKILGVYVDRNALAARLIDNLIFYLNKFTEQGFACFIDEWMISDSMMGQDVTLKNINDKVSGNVAGINKQGHLLLKLADGNVRAFSSGDASVVKK